MHSFHDKPLYDQLVNAKENQNEMFRKGKTIMKRWLLSSQYTLTRVNYYILYHKKRISIY